MVINIEKTIIRKKLFSLYKTVFLILAIVAIVVVDLYYSNFFGFEVYILYIILGSMYLISVIFNLIRDYNYIFYSDEGEKIIFRYFSPGAFTSKKNSIEINKPLFAGYRIEKTFLGLKEKIILSQKTKTGIANYPPVSITALSTEEKNKLLKSLSTIR